MTDLQTCNNLEIKYCESSSFILLKYYVGYSKSSTFQVYFRINLLMSTNEPPNGDKVEFINQVGKNRHVYNTVSFDLKTKSSICLD